MRDLGDHLECLDPRGGALFQLRRFARHGDEGAARLLAGHRLGGAARIVGGFEQIVGFNTVRVAHYHLRDDLVAEHAVTARAGARGLAMSSASRPPARRRTSACSDDVTKSREVDMHAGNSQAVCGGHVHNSLTGRDRLRPVHINRQPRVGASKLDRVQVHDVAPDQKHEPIPDGETSAACPFCSARPLAGVLRPEGDGGKRSLVCSLCATEWNIGRMWCPGCGERNVRRPGRSTRPISSRMFVSNLARHLPVLH